MSGPYYADENVTLWHGDSLDILRAMPDNSVDSIVTDPPYKLSQEYGTATDADNLLAVASICLIARQMARVARPGTVCALFYDTRILPLALPAMREGGWRYLRAVTLYRRWGNASMLHGWMTTSDFVLVFATPGAKPTFYGTASHDVYIRDRPEPVSYGHPAQKPLVHCRHIVSRITPPSGVVLDPYLGSGTVGVAARLEGFRFIGIESDSHWINVATNRLTDTQIDRQAEQGTLDIGGAA